MRVKVSLILVISLLFATFSIGVNAADVFTISVENETYVAETNEVEIDIVFANNSGVASTGFQVVYDAEALTYTGYSAGEVFPAAELTVTGKETSVIIDGTTADGSNNTADGVVATLTFGVNEGIVTDTYAFEIDIESNAVLFGAFDTDGNNVAVDTADGSIELEGIEIKDFEITVANEAFDAENGEVTLDVVFANNPGVASVGFQLVYDAEALTYADYETAEEVFPAAELTVTGKETAVVIDGTTADGSNNTANGVVATLTFTVDGCLAADTYDFEIDITSDATIFGAYNTDGVEVAAVTADGSLTVAEAVHGSYTTVVTDPTCEEAGYTTYTCACGSDVYTADETAELGHTWGEWEVVEEATEDAVGREKRVCGVCGEVEEEDIPMLDHTCKTFTLVEEDPATCEENGTKAYYECDKCGLKYSDAEGNNRVADEDLVIPEAHTYGDAVVDVPTCTEAGSKTYTCSACGKDVVETIPATGHTWGEWEVVEEATEDEEGLEQRTCSVCGGEQTREIAKVDDDKGDNKNDYIINSLRYYAMTQINRTFTVKTSTNEGGEIEGPSTVKYGKDAAYEITVDEGYEVVSVKVNGVEIGAVEEVLLENVRINTKIEVKFAEIVEVIDEAIVEEAWVNPFVDIFESDSYYEAIEFVYENGLFKGVSETEFAPATTMTRAMFVTVLGRLHGITEDYVGENTFADVVEGEWYAPYVVWAADNGIVLGYGDGTFGINDEITVEQAAVILARYAAFIDLEVAAEYDLEAEYADAADVAEWAEEAMSWAVAEGIYEGTEGCLNPQAPASRALIATMLYGFAY